MKIGFILECTLGGADMQICRFVAERQCPAFVLEDRQFRTMANKEALKDGCGDEAANLLDDGCDHVFVVWDLRPAWKSGDGDALDCVEECDLIRSQLDKAGVPRGKVTCLCITRELEVWLLADRDALEKFCSRDAHKCASIPSPGALERIDWPKKRVEALCEERGRRFTANLHALKIIQNADRKKLRKVKSYARLEDKLSGLCPKAVEPKHRAKAWRAR